jgi:hypothetical protein
LEPGSDEAGDGDNHQREDGRRTVRNEGERTTHENVGAGGT